jgi:1,2-diacylglycerol 3-alpha-glucosyltransferase
LIAPAQPGALPCAIVFDNFGPYHVARLTAAARVCEIVAVELKARSRTYAWQGLDSLPGLRKFTLLDGNAAASTPGRELRPLLDEKMPAALGAICVNGWGDFAAPQTIEWAVRRRIPVILMSESSALDGPRRFWRELVKRRLVRCAAAGLVGGTPHRDYLAGLGLPARRIFTGYDAVDNDYFARGADAIRARAAEVRREHGLPDKFFLASARFVEKKNLPRLVAAFGRYRQLPARTPLWDLVILGDGPQRAELCCQISDAGLGACVHLPGFRQYPDLPVFYGLAGAFIHASRVEQWGLVVNEAMAAGLPVLVSNRCGCAADLVADGQNGFTFDPLDVEAMAGAMGQTAALPEPQRAAMGRASREIIRQWGPAAFAEGLRRALETIRLDPRPAPGALTRAVLAALARR